MTAGVFARHAAVLRTGLAADLGCDPAALASNALTVVPRPPDAREPQYPALAVTMGTGSVLSVEPALIPWVEAHQPHKHFRIFQPFFLADLAAEATRLGGGQLTTAHGTTLGFILAEDPPVPAVPAGFRLAEVDHAWMDRYRPSAVFDNALGEPDEHERIEKMLAAFALLDAEREPAAVAGAWDEGHGRLEIGLDVRRDQRGQGLARPAVLAAAHWVLARGATPIYTCGATNIRSQRVARSCGFAPAWTLAALYRHPTGQSPYDH